jgi:hypothetical protein
MYNPASSLPRRLSSLLPSCFTSGDRAPGIHQIGGSVVPQPVWTTCGRDSSWSYFSVIQSLYRLHYRDSFQKEVMLWKYGNCILNTVTCVRRGIVVWYPSLIIGDPDDNTPTPRTTVRTTDATAKTQPTTFDLVPPINEHRVQRWSLTCIVSCKGNGHKRHPQRHPTPLQPPAASSSPTLPVQQVPGSHLRVFHRKLIPQRRSRIHYDHCAANGTTIHTYGWLPLSLNMGLRREPTHGALFLNGTGSHFYVSSRQLIPQRRSPPTLERLTTIPTDGWLPHSLNLGLHSEHT